MSPKLRTTLTPKTSTRVSLRRILVRSAIATGVAGILVFSVIFLYNNLGTSEDSLAQESCHAFSGGVYRIGGTGSTPSPGCDFVDLSAAASAINSGTIDGPVVFVLTSTYSSAQENSFPVEFYNISGTSTVNTVTIRPDAGVSPVISGSGQAIIKLRQISNFIIDGSNNGTDSKNLTIVNNYQQANTAVVWISGTSVSSGPKNITIKNTNISHAIGDNWSKPTFGIFLSGSSIGNSYSSSYLCMGASNIRIENNNISKSLWGIWGAGHYSSQLDSIYILRNVIGSDVANDYVGFCGIDLEEVNHGMIKDNIVKNIKSAIGSSAVTRPTGMWFGTLNNTYILNNIIKGVSYTSNQTYGGKGIEIYGMRHNTDCNVTIANNIIYDITGRGGQIDKGTCGIRIMPTGMSLGNIKLYYNTINLSGNLLSNNSRSACLYIASNGTLNNIDVRNNCFMNTITGSSSKTKCYAIFIDPDANIFNHLDYNNYYAAGTNGVMGCIKNKNKSTLDEWMAATGKDKRSLSGSVTFVAGSELVPDADHTSSWILSGKATQLTAINFDFNYNTRSTNPAGGIPCIGAYEFDINPGVVPTNTTMAGYPDDDETSSFKFMEQTVAYVTWHGVQLPTTVNVKYYTNMVPEDATSGNTSFAYWEVTSNGGSPFVFDLELTYDESMLGTIGSQYDIMIAQSVQQGSWQAYENTAVDAINKTVRVNGMEGLNGRFILTDKSNPLPITLISFEAKLQDAKVKLNWATASETNNDYFTIERSENAKNFKPIAIVDGAGNSNTVLRYQTYDNDPVQGVNYYRLKQTDFDGKYSYSQIISVNTGGTSDEAAIEVTSFGPNPFSTYFMMTFTAESEQLVNINIFNSGGQLVFSEPFGAHSGENTYTYNDHLNLPRGIYLVNISQDKQKTKFTKLIKE